MRGWGRDRPQASCSAEWDGASVVAEAASMLGSWGKLHPFHLRVENQIDRKSVV